MYSLWWWNVRLSVFLCFINFLLYQQMLTRPGYSLWQSQSYLQDKMTRSNQRSATDMQIFCIFISILSSCHSHVVIVRVMKVLLNSSYKLGWWWSGDYTETVVNSVREENLSYLCFSTILTTNKETQTETEKMCKLLEGYYRAINTFYQILRVGSPP